MRLVQLIRNNDHPNLVTPVISDTDSPSGFGLWVEMVEIDGAFELDRAFTRNNPADDWEEVPIVSEEEALA